jgi:hypothetical protein
VVADAMKILWNPNPLATVIELDDFDKRLLRLRLTVEKLQQRMFEAYFDLNPQDRAWHNKEVGDRPLEAAVEAALKALDVPYVGGDEKRSGKSFEEYIDEQLDECVHELSSVHCGDCTCVPSSCMKCYVEGLVGTNTTAGLDKHAGSSVQGAFMTGPKGGLVPTLDEAIESLREYRPTKGDGWGNRSDEEFQSHVPRWIEEAKTAHVWLVAYRREHFAT